MTLHLKINLARWIIEDGNYADFCVGEKRKFALEFWTSFPMSRTTENSIILVEQAGHSYDVVGRLLFVSDAIRVIDCGVLAYSEWKDDVKDGSKAGDLIQGNLSFGVDPFPYLETHSKIPGIPPLIYEWQINSIDQNTTPFVLSKDGRTYKRDENARSLKAVHCTSKDTITSDQAPEFLLHCSKLQTEPTHRLH